MRSLSYQLWSHISATWVRRGNYSAAGMAFSSTSCLLFSSMAPSWYRLTNHYRNASPFHAVHTVCFRKSRFVHNLVPLLPPVQNPLSSHEGIVYKGGKQNVIWRKWLAQVIKTVKKKKKKLKEKDKEMKNYKALKILSTEMK